MNIDFCGLKEGRKEITLETINMTVNEGNQQPVSDPVSFARR